MKHSNVAIFIPHNGCPNKCSFCEQNSITGKSLQPTLEDVKNTIELSIKNLGSRVKNTEIAFFGGSFTAIDKKYMNALLDLANKYVKEYSFARSPGRVKEIRSRGMSSFRASASPRVLAVLSVLPVALKYTTQTLFMSMDAPPFSPLWKQAPRAGCLLVLTAKNPLRSVSPYPGPRDGAAPA